MSEIAERSEEEILDSVAEALTGMGLRAMVEDTGGGMLCVILEHKDGGEIAWGTADVTWGAAITDEDGEQVSSITTEYPSSSQDEAAIAQALFDPSVENGAIVDEP